jgi:hypothetical protein
MNEARFVAGRSIVEQFGFVRFLAPQTFLRASQFGRKADAHSPLYREGQRFFCAIRYVLNVRREKGCGEKTRQTAPSVPSIQST